MGENVLSSQASNSRKRRAKRSADHEQGRLFQRKEIVVEQFTVDRTAACTLKPGDLLHCFPGKGNALVDVVYENRQIGVVKDAGGESLANRAKEKGCCSGIVVGDCAISDTLTIQLHLEKEE